MPFVVDPNNTGDRMISGISDVDYGYNYPGGLDLKPNSPLHEQIKRRLLEDARSSWSVMQTKHSEWQKVDDTCRAFIPADAKEQQLQAQDPRKPISVVVPLTFAVKETILAHLLGIYTSGPELWPLGPGQPEDTIGVALLERVVNTQAEWFSHLLNLHTQLQDGIMKGIGAVSPMWEVKYGLRTTQPVIDPMTGMMIAPPSRERYVRREGNRLRNICPYLYLPDPGVSASDVQDGEFVGWTYRSNRNAILSEEASSNGLMFNAKYLRHGGDLRSSLMKDIGYGDTSRPSIAGYSVESGYGNNLSPADRLVLYRRLIPAEWGLGPNDYPELWVFELIGDQVIVRAQPADLNHDMFPVAVCAPDYDGYSATPLGRLAITLGLQSIGDFQMNSDVANQRKMLNDMIVVDPSVVNTNDLRSPTPGKVIRLRRSAFGQGVRDAIMQLQVQDMTSNNMNKLSFIDSVMKAASGATDSMQGLFAGGERRSAQEARDTHTAAMGRIAKLAYIIHEQALKPLTYMMACQTQQFMSMETWVKLQGAWEQELRAEYGGMLIGEQLQQGKWQPGMPPPMPTMMPVGPQNIQVDFDVRGRDNLGRGGEYLSDWIQLYQTILQDPQAFPVMDTTRIVLHLARLMGVNNAQDFIRKTPFVVADDQNVEEEAKKGNLVPAEEA